MGLERRGIGEEAGERSRGASLYHVLGFGNFSCGPADRLRFGYDLRDLHFGETAVRQCGGGTEEGQRSWKTLDHPHQSMYSASSRQSPWVIYSSDKYLFSADSVAGPVPGSWDKAVKQERPSAPTGTHLVGETVLISSSLTLTTQPVRHHVPSSLSLKSFHSALLSLPHLW